VVTEPASDSVPAPNPVITLADIKLDVVSEFDFSKYRPYLDLEMGSGVFMGPARLGQVRVGYVFNSFGFSLGMTSLKGSWGALEIPNCNCESPSVSEDENGQLPVVLNRDDSLTLQSVSLGMHMVSKFAKLGNWNLWSQFDLSSGELSIPAVNKKIGMNKLGLEFGWIYHLMSLSNLKYKLGFSHHVAEIKGTLQYPTKGHHFFMQTTQVVGGLFYFF
jgi:hypothetical protein